MPQSYLVSGGVVGAAGFGAAPVTAMVMVMVTVAVWVSRGAATAGVLAIGVGAGLAVLAVAGGGSGLVAWAGVGALALLVGGAGGRGAIGLACAASGMGGRGVRGVSMVLFPLLAVHLCRRSHGAGPRLARLQLVAMEVFHGAEFGWHGRTVLLSALAGVAGNCLDRHSRRYLLLKTAVSICGNCAIA